MGLFARIERIFREKGQHCRSPVSVHSRIGDSHGPDGHAPRTGNMPMGHSSQTLNYTQLDLLFFHHQLSFVHQSLLLFHLYIRLDLHAIGLAPNSDLGPCRMLEILL